MYPTSNIAALLLLSFTLLGLSCATDDDIIVDPLVEYSQVIENNSDVSLLLITNTSASVDSVIIMTDEEQIVFSFSGIGAIAGLDECDVNEESGGDLSLGVALTDSLTVNRDPNQSSNWQFTLIEDYGNGGGKGECRLVINNDDIE
ncbi:MAG: hypothetical protein AAFN81_18120 [Bacteroidota bacterium]